MADVDASTTAAEEPGLRMICPACNRSYDAGEFVCKACGSGLLEIPDAPLLSGNLLDDRYDVEGVVGTGGMGTVYRARQRGMEREVAVKVLHAHYAHQPRAVKRFFREAQAASKLVHPNIVTVYDFGRSLEGHLYMVMELLEGWTLGDLIHYRAPLDPALAIAIGAQICDALGEAHRRRLVHRDLKPDNVLLTTVEDGLWAKVLDFGIARAMRDPESSLTINQSTVEIAGTPSYMSPEQILGKEPDPRSDLYALGIILFEMLTKRRPFDDESSVALCMKQLNETAPRVSSVVAAGTALDAVVAGLLEKSADARPQDAQEVRALLLACPEARGPIDFTGLLDPQRARSLSQKTTRGDAAIMMVQPTLDSSLDPRGNNPSLGVVIDRAKEQAAAVALSSLADLHFVELPKGADEPRRASSSSPPPLPGAARADSKRRKITAIAQIIGDHPSVMRALAVTRWTESRERDGWSLSVEAQKIVVRIHGEGGDAEDPSGSAELIGRLVELQGEALRGNLALRIGAASVTPERSVADAMDLSRRLAASSGHGVVTVPREIDMGSVDALDIRPQSEVFLPDGKPIACVALRQSEAGAAFPTLLWGRSLPLRRLGQLADEARRAGPVTAVVTGGRGLGRSALVKSFVTGRTHLFVRVAPGAAMWPGHTAATLVAAAHGIWPLTGRLDDLDGLEVDTRQRELLELLLADKAADDAPTLRALARLVVDALANYAGDGPLAIVIDDAHLMDRASQELLDVALELAQGRPWCVVGTSRWLKPGMFLAGAHRIDLRPLSLRASNAALDALGVGPRQRHALMAAAHGNPLALHLLAHASEEGRDLPTGDVVPALLPEYLRSSPAAAADKAWVGAALGDPMADDFATQGARLYLEAGLTDALSTWLVDRLGRLGPVPRALAAQWTAARADDHAARAERCERLGLWRQAALEYETAVALVPPDERGKKQLRAAHMRARAGDIRGAVASWDASLRAGVGQQRPTELLGFAGALLDLGEQERASQVLEHVGAAIDPAVAPRSFAEVLALKARAAVRRSDPARAMTWLNEARVATERLKRTDARAARALEALTQEIRAEIATSEGDRETARVNLRQARDAFRDLGRHAEALRCLIDLGRLELEGDMASRAGDTFRAALRLAAAAGLGREVFRAEVGLGEALTALGEVDEGAALLRRCLRRAGDADESGGLALAAVAMARAMLRRGLWADAQRYVERARTSAPSRAVLARAWQCEGESWLGQGQARKGARALNQALALASECGDGLLRRQIEVRLAPVVGALRVPTGADLPPVLAVG